MTYDSEFGRVEMKLDECIIAADAKKFKITVDKP